MTSSIEFLRPLHIIGNIYDDGNIENKNISAIEILDDRLVLGADEGCRIAVLKKTNENGYRVERTISLNQDETIVEEEIDIEGIAWDDNKLYVVGSHSYKREAIDPEKSYEVNREAIETITLDPRRNQLFRLTLDATPQIEQTSLQSIIENEKILKLFSEIPSKENGIDIEGIAAHKGFLYIGFRGPVLRGNWVPVLKCKFAQPITKANLMFVNLGGRGIRDLTRVKDGFLILAGSVGDGSESYQVFFWNGEDCLPDKSHKVGQIEKLGNIPVYDNMKAEGIALVKETKSSYTVLIVFDGVENGAPVRLKIRKN